MESQRQTRTYLTARRYQTEAAIRMLRDVVAGAPAAQRAEIESQLQKLEQTLRDTVTALDEARRASPSTTESGADDEGATSRAATDPKRTDSEGRR